MRTSFVSLIVRADGETDAAICCTFEDSTYGAHQELWIPKRVLSQESLDTLDTISTGEIVEIDVAQWWMDKRL